jgi:hypothetical protein
MVTAIYKASKFIDKIFIYCHLTSNYIKHSYSAKTLIAIGTEEEKFCAVP